VIFDSYLFLNLGLTLFLFAVTALIFWFCAFLFDKPYHLYLNPVNNKFLRARFTVRNRFIPCFFPMTGNLWEDQVKLCHIKLNSMFYSHFAY